MDGWEVVGKWLECVIWVENHGESGHNSAQKCGEFMGQLLGDL